MERIELHEIPGFSFGQVQDVAAGTGCTVSQTPSLTGSGVIPSVSSRTRA